MAFALCVKYEIDDQGNEVEVAFEGIMRVKFGDEEIWDRPKSEQRQKQEMKAETGPRNLAQVTPSVQKRCWANVKHSVVMKLERCCMFLVGRSRRKTCWRRCTQSTELFCRGWLFSKRSFLQRMLKFFALGFVSCVWFGCVCVL